MHPWQKWEMSNSEKPLKVEGTLFWSTSKLALRWCSALKGPHQAGYEVRIWQTPVPDN